MRIEPKWTFTDVRHAAIAFGRELERRMPGEVTTKWWKEERGEKVFIDYNQNARDRTIASPYSIRAKPGAPVSAPLLWDEVPDVAPEDFTVATMPARFADVGDRFAEIDDGVPLAPAAAGHVRARRGGRHALPARLSEDARRAQARAALAGHGPQEEVKLEVLQADVTKLEVDAIANAANTQLLHGGGVAAAIARAGGPAVDEESRAAAPIGLGEAVETTAGDMPARWVIHAATMELGGPTSAEIIAAATRSTLARADELGARRSRSSRSAPASAGSRWRRRRG